MLQQIVRHALTVFEQNKHLFVTFSAIKIYSEFMTFLQST